MRFTCAVGPPIALGIATVMLAACSRGPGRPEPTKIPITTSSENALEEYLKGRDLAEKLRATDARDHYVAAATEDPGFALAYLGLVDTAPTAAEFFDALRRAIAAVEGVSRGEAHMIRAAEAGANGRPDEQFAQLTALVREYPSDERAHNLLALFYFARQEWQQATVELRKATEINPVFSQPYNQLGYALRYLDDYAGAEKAFLTYIHLIPKEPNPYDSYAELLMKMGRFRDSITQYEKALAINPNFANSYVGIGNDQIFLGQPRDARNTFTTLGFIARNDGERRQALLWTAISYLHEGNNAKALEEVSRMYQIAGRSDDALAMAGDLTLMGDILLESGRTDEAQAKYDAAVDAAQRAVVTPDVKQRVRRNHLFCSARVALLRGNLASAAAAADGYRAAVEERRIPAEVRRAHELLGLIALAKGEFALAISELEQGNPQDPRVLFELARAYAGAGQGQQAKRVLERAANFNGFDFNYAFVRTKALAASKDPSRLAQRTSPASD